MSQTLAQTVLANARARGLRIAVAESCTGGLVGAELTAIAGSSDVFDRGFVTYSNEAKRDMLGVPAEILDTAGAVSAETARAMAEGALARSNADVAISVTGIAGPGGGTADKPVGLVWFAVAARGHATHAKHRLYAGFGRATVRKAAAETALRLLNASMGHGHVDGADL